MQYKRSDRVAELLRREISKIILEEMKDPAINLLTITEVKLSADLKSSKVYYSVLGDESQREAIQKKLDQSTGFIRSEIGHRLTLRSLPEIRFYYDIVSDRARTIENILSKIREAES